MVQIQSSHMFLTREAAQRGSQSLDGSYSRVLSSAKLETNNYTSFMVFFATFGMLTAFGVFECGSAE